MVDVKTAQLSVYKLEIDDPLFFFYIFGNSACDILKSIEDQFQVKFRFEKRSVLVEGRGRIDIDLIRNKLVEAWKEDDFKRAIEVSELTNLSDFQLYFKVSPAESALMQVNAKKLLRCPDLIAFKADAAGNVCLFGKNSSASEIYEMVSEIVYQAAVCGNIQSYFDGPCTLTMRIPQKLVSSIMSPDSSEFIELRYSCHFFIEKIASADEGEQRLGVLINIFTKSVKDAVCYQLDMFNGKRKPLEIKIRCGTFTLCSSGSCDISGRDSFKVILSAVEIQLIFWVQERDAPRIIGSHGITKKRIQECSKCKVLLHTETKRNGFFPVEIIGPSIQKCVETRHRIESFLMQTPPVITGREQQWSFSSVDDGLYNVNGVSTLPMKQPYLCVHNMLQPPKSVGGNVIGKSLYESYPGPLRLLISRAHSMKKSCEDSKEMSRNLDAALQFVYSQPDTVTNERLRD
uniref:KH domain-containing protein n=1 Tax=Syphacia muris TaxID=451379 RepID=A0A0N5AJY5_9BILA